LSAEPSSPSALLESEAFTAPAADGYPISGRLWRHAEAAAVPRPVAIICPATSVRCRYYARFAAFLVRHGMDALIFDYRGIGESRPARLRGFPASWIDWGERDVEAVLRHVRQAFPSQPIDVVGHSIGGFILGLAPSSAIIRRIVTVGAQYAYWRDYAPEARLAMLAKWHLAMPLLALLFSYFPGAKLGWIEDTPTGVVRDWALSRARFEESWRGRSPRQAENNERLCRRLASVTAPILAVSLGDDEFGTVAAIERSLAYFRRSPRTHLRIAPAAIGAEKIGHFGFFHSRFEQSLWPVALGWLRAGEVAPNAPGIVVRRMAAAAA